MTSNTIPIFAVAPEDKDNCPICLSTMEYGSIVAVTPCRHVFCPPCANQAFPESRAYGCPMCRTDLDDWQLAMLAPPMTEPTDDTRTDTIDLIKTRLTLLT